MSLKADACPHTHRGIRAPAPGLLSYKGCLGTEQLELPSWRCAVMSPGEPKQQAKNQPLGLVVCYLLPLIHFSLFGSSNQNELIWDFQAVGCFSSGSFLLSSGLWGLAAI